MENLSVFNLTTDFFTLSTQNSSDFEKGKSFTWRPRYATVHLKLIKDESLLEQWYKEKKQIICYNTDKTVIYQKNIAFF